MHKNTYVHNHNEFLTIGFSLLCAIFHGINFSTFVPHEHSFLKSKV